MIRNVVLHLQGEQPMKADIESLPTAADAGLLCTNLRTLEGRKPMSTEFLDSVFLVPYNVIRFIEIPRSSIGSDDAAPGMPTAPAQLPGGAPGGATIAPTGGVPPPAAVSPQAEPEPDDEEDAIERLEPDEDLLRRIREA